MTVKLYKRDPYMFEFEATVTATDGDWVALDVSAFYPGGGGQGKDTGTVQGLPVHDLRAKDDILWHLIPGSPLQPGTRVWCSVDWERRYQLMRA
ncbi:MAG: alanyl-tRNA editing protein, partial [Spirochaetia bacterium]|nr:alanyl-tRNA editing protein [Spirochaetia bacterium]